MSTPQARPRPSGGFNPSMGGFSDEHLDQNALAQMMGQKKQAQQGASGGPMASPTQAKSSAPTYAGPGTVLEEVISRPAAGVAAGIKDLITGFFDIKNILGDSKSTDTEDQKAKRKALHQRYSQLTEEQQAVAQQKYQQEMQRKKVEEEEKIRKQEQEKQKNAQSFSMPASTKKGPVGPSGSKKKQATQKLQQDRQTLSGPQSAN